MTGILGVLLNAAKTLGGLVGQLKKAKREKRERVAGYFDEIATTLHDVARRIEAGEPGHDTCVRLAVFAEQLDEVLEGLGPVSHEESLDATRARFKRELQTARYMWMAVESPQVRGWRRVKNALGSGGDSPAADLLVRRADRVEADLASVDAEGATKQVLAELPEAHADRVAATQQIWDAAGEFRALAAALRAR
jgi:hypothetical protein